jgi:hypothetical protein
MKNILLSLLAVSSIATAATEAEVKAEVSYRDQIMIQAEQFVERAVNMIVTPFFSDKDVECLARNIFYESGSEPLEGKVAVGLVTINRSQDPRYPNTICGVVHQKLLYQYHKRSLKSKWSRLACSPSPKKSKKLRPLGCQKPYISSAGSANVYLKSNQTIHAGLKAVESLKNSAAVGIKSINSNMATL